MEIAKEQQQEQSAQDTQFPPPNPPHETPTYAKTVIVKDFPDTSSQKINPFTVEDLKKILYQTTSKHNCAQIQFQ